MAKWGRSTAIRCLFFGVLVLAATSWAQTRPQTPPRHPCHQWELKLTGSSRGKSPLGTRHFLPYTRSMYYML